MQNIYWDLRLAEASNYRPDSVYKTAPTIAFPRAPDEGTFVLYGEH